MRGLSVVSISVRPRYRSAGLVKWYPFDDTSYYCILASFLMNPLHPEKLNFPRHPLNSGTVGHGTPHDPPLPKVHVCVCVLIRDQTRHPDRPTTAVSASSARGFIGLNKGVGSCIPSYGPGGVGGGRAWGVMLSPHRTQGAGARRRPHVSSVLCAPVRGRRELSRCPLKCSKSNLK